VREAAPKTKETNFGNLKCNRTRIAQLLVRPMLGRVNRLTWEVLWIVMREGRAI
jgi:hypothetical protein